jgi:hypothetical protein
LSSGHRVIDITNGHFIHAGPLEGIGVSIYLPAPTSKTDHDAKKNAKVGLGLLQHLQASTNFIYSFYLLAQIEGINQFHIQHAHDTKGLRAGPYFIRAYLSFIKHTSPKTVCNLEVIYLVDWTLESALQVPKLVYSKPFGTNWQQTYKGVKFLCCMDERYVCM